MSFFVENIKQELKDNIDVISREIQSASGLVELIFLKSMTDKNEISEQIIAPIMREVEMFSFEDIAKKL